jgi:cytochrome c-type biogenesis protein CcmH
MALLWVAMAALAALAMLPVLWVLGRPGQPRSADEPAVAVYRDQLDELKRDLARGIVAEGEASAARNEIARRLIRAGENAPDAPAPGGGRSRAIASSVVIAAAIAAVGLYLRLGSPELPDQPLVARLSAPIQDQDVAALVARVEDHLAAIPEDGRGWEVIAPVYLRIGRVDDAIRAFSNALRILGPNADLEASLGEAIIVANAGLVTADARAAFERAASLAPDDPRPKFYLALALGQEGRRDEAIAAWRALLADAPADAPWLPMAQAELTGLEAAGGAEAAGPGAADIEAAAGLTPQERATMIEGMVGSLAARLVDQPGDAEGWARLIRSYMVLDRPDDARAALIRARAAVADDAIKLGLIEATAREVGLAP